MEDENKIRDGRRRKKERNRKKNIDDEEEKKNEKVEWLKQRRKNKMTQM